MTIPDKDKIRKQLRILCRRSTIRHAAEQLGLSRRTAIRILGPGIAKRGRPKTKITVIVRKPCVEVSYEQIEEAYVCLRQAPFPYAKQLSDELTRRELLCLQRQHIVIQNGIIHPWNHFGVRICNPFFPNRYNATWKNSMSAVMAWSDTRTMKRAIRFQLRHGDPTTPHRILRAITLLCRTPTIFKPSIAKFIYQRYTCPGAVVWDPCSGYGGRLLGAFVSGVHYVGTDVEPETIEGNRRLAEVLGARYDLFVSPAEIFEPPPVDLVFTSPPYFDREHYSESEHQSWKKHGRSLAAWIDGFLLPVIQRARRALRPGGRLILNVADLQENGKTIPVVDQTIAAALTSGFLHVETLRMPISAINRRLSSEPLLVFQ